MVWGFSCSLKDLEINFYLDFLQPQTIYQHLHSKSNAAILYCKAFGNRVFLMEIFLIEDDEIYAEYISKSLMLKPDRVVRHFASGEALLGYLTNHPHSPYAIIIDFDLPGIKGIDLFEKLNGTFERGQVKIIMLSGLDDGKIVLGFIRRGVRDYVIKDENAVESLNAILDGKEEEMLFS